jgi:nucleotide-binding universal stress UspA family protein
MTSKRRSFEAGHRRKFLVVIDETPECDRAVYYAARRAQHTGGALVFLYVIANDGFQHWLGVESIMRAEAEEEARKRIFHFIDRVREAAGIDPEMLIREGVRSDELVRLIEEDEDIAILVLAAGIGSEGPGPLVSNLAGRVSGTFPIPITIVPGNLTDQEIDALA